MRLVLEGGVGGFLGMFFRYLRNEVDFMGAWVWQKLRISKVVHWWDSVVEDGKCSGSLREGV